MKKKLFAMAVILICISILASTTLAYFTAEGTAHNVITSGAVQIRVEEWQDLGGQLVPYPETPIQVMPNAVVSKIVNIRNLEAGAYIRARFDIVIKNPDGSVMEVSPETLASVISVTMDGDHWVRKAGDSQWWYYADPVDPEEITEPFFTEVVFDGPNMTNEYQNCTVEITVSAQAVQQANNGTGVLTAAGWPEA